jgi:hypothetical protein
VTNQSENLESRLIRFLGSRKGSETIDSLSMTREQERAEKADFFLSRRTVVCELKSLKTDTSGKIESLLEPLLNSPDAPAFYGSWPIEKILKHFPDGEQLRRKMFEKMTTAIEDLFENANRQIRTTKTSFGLHSAEGALVLANDFLSIHTPETLGHRVSQLMTKKTRDGAIRYPHVNAVWIISEMHFVEVAHGVKALPAITVQRDGESQAFNLLQTLQKEWAEFNGIPILEMDAHLMATTEFKENSQPMESKPPARFEVMQKLYELNPYLRGLSDDELGVYYQRLMTFMGFAAMKGARPDEKESLVPLMERFGHFLEEVKHRGLALKRYASLMQGILENRPAQKPVSAKLAELDALCSKPAELKPDTFYTDRAGKVYRCMQCDEKSATLLLMDTLLGKSLHAIVRSNSDKWSFFSILRDDQTLQAYRERFERFQAKHPNFFSRAASRAS